MRSLSRKICKFYSFRGVTVNLFELVIVIVKVKYRNTLIYREHYGLAALRIMNLPTAW